MIWPFGLSVFLFLLMADLPRYPWGHGSAAMGFVLALIAVPPGFGLAQALVPGGPDGDPGKPDRSWARVRVLVWFVCGLAVVTLTGWPEQVRSGWLPAGWPLLDEILIVIPSLVSLALLRASERWISGRIRQTAGCAAGTLRFRNFAGLVILPVLVMFVYRDLVLFHVAGPAAELVLCGGFAILLLLLWLLYPVLVGWIWSTRALPDRQLQRDLDAMCDRRGIRKLDIRYWDTGGTATNAVVVGAVPGLRRVFLTDELLRRFSRDEIRAIFRHELGHVSRGHLWTRGAVLLAPLTILVALAAGFLHGTETGWLADYWQTRVWLVWFLLPASIVCYLGTVVIPLIRHQELQADDDAMRDDAGGLCASSCRDYHHALVKLAACQPQPAAGSLWHPPLGRRLQRIGQRIHLWQGETPDSGIPERPALAGPGAGAGNPR